MNPAFSLAGASLLAQLVYRQKAWGAFGFQILIINIPTYIKKVKLSSNLSKCVTAQDLGSVSAAAHVSVTVNLGGRAPTVLSLMFLKRKISHIPDVVVSQIYSISLYLSVSPVFPRYRDILPSPTSLLDIQTAGFGSLSPRGFSLFSHPLLFLLAFQVLLRLLECFSYPLCVYHLYSFTGLRGSAGNGNISR